MDSTLQWMHNLLRLGVTLWLLPLSKGNSSASSTVRTKIDHCPRGGTHSRLQVIETSGSHFEPKKRPKHLTYFDQDQTEAATVKQFSSGSPSEQCPNSPFATSAYTGSHILIDLTICMYIYLFIYFIICFYLFLFIYLSLFPTCQVRVVRFYQSCSPRLAVLLVLVLRLLLLLCLLLQFLLDHVCINFHLNFRLANSSPSSLPTSKLSVHRWTSTWDQTSSVCTAGPHPGTFPAQCAPLDLNLGPNQLSVHRWTSTWDLPSSVCTAVPQRPDRMPEDMPDKMPWDMPDRMPEAMPDRMLEDMPDRMPEGMPERMPDKMSDRLPENMPDRMPEGMPERMPDKMSDRLPEDMPDRMPEDMPDKIFRRYARWNARRCAR